jgi:hypothetical protein
MKIFSGLISCMISMLAPSRVPMMRAPAGEHEHNRDKAEAANTIHGEFHVARAACLRARRADVLREIRSRNNNFGQADIVVRDEINLRTSGEHFRSPQCSQQGANLEKIANGGVIVDNIRDGIDHLDNALGGLQTHVSKDDTAEPAEKKKAEPAGEEKNRQQSAFWTYSVAGCSLATEKVEARHSNGALLRGHGLDLEIAMDDAVCTC